MTAVENLVRNLLADREKVIPEPFGGVEPSGQERALGAIDR